MIARGAASGQELAARGADAVAAAAGLELVVFPGGHAGFAGAEFGQTGEPDGFAAALRRVLDGS